MIAFPMAGGFLALDNAETWVLAAFLLFVGLLVYLGVPGVIGRALDARAEGIRRQIEEARNLRDEAQRKLAEAERRMKDAEKQSADIVAHAKTEAEGAAVNARDEIENLVARRIQTATDRIARAEADAVRAVRNTAVDAAVEAVSAVMKSSADTAQANNAGAISAIVQGLAR